MDIGSSLTILPLIIMDSCFLTPRTRESFCPTDLQFLSLSDSSDTTSDISMQILVPTMEQIPVLLALSKTVHGARTEVSPEVVWEGARTRFPHRWDVWEVLLVHCMFLHAGCFTSFPIPSGLIHCLRAALTRGCRAPVSHFVLLPKILLIFQY